jgi:FKBP-type peptidyl-prolyl cis-trans isomerase
LKGTSLRRLGLVLLVSSFALSGAVIPAAAAASPLTDVTVTGAVGTEPTVKFSKPLSATNTVHRDIVTGTGKKLAKGDKVTFKYLALDGRTAKQIESSFDKSPATLVLDKKRSVAGLVKSLVGATVGSRVLIALAPKEGVTRGLQGSGVKKNDTVVFVVDVTDVRAPLKHATGTPVPPVEGLPTVKLAKNGKPAIKVPSAPPPTTLIVQPLVEGTGPVVTAGQTITVHYTGVIWTSGKQFDSSWDRGEPVDFAIGQGQVIAGWDEGLVGQTVGSQVLLVVPPDKGYGATGQPNAGISGTDTLVFVVDILDAF